ncbi:MAG: GumC family protein [Vicinamibacteria bacterium]
MNTISRALKKAREAHKPLSPIPPRESVLPKPPPSREVSAPIAEWKEAPPTRYHDHAEPRPRPSLERAASPAIVPLHLRDYLELALKRRWLLFGITALVPIVATFFTLRQTPEYFATAVLQVSRERVRLVEDITVDGFQSGDEFYATQLRLLASKPFAERVTRRLELWKHPWFRTEIGAGQEIGPEATGPIADTIRWWVQPANYEGTQLIETSYSTPDPNLSADLANALAAEYISFLSESETGVAQNAATFIQEQIEKLQADIAATEKALAESASPDSRLTLASQRLTELNTQLTAAESERVAAQIRYETLAVQDPRELPPVVASEFIKASQERYETLQQEHDELASRFGPEWPELQRAKAALEEARKRLEAAVKETAGSVVNAARLEYENALKRETQLRQQLGGQRYATEQMARSSTDFESQRVDLESKKSLLEQLLRREREAGMSADLGERPPINARIVEEATAPGGPYKPNLQKNLVLATAAGLCIALGLALFLEYWEAKIDTPDQLRRRFSIPYLGYIPAFLPPRKTRSRWPWSRHQELPLDELYLALPLEQDETPDDFQRSIAERFKMLRTMLLSSKNPSRTILVTSPDARTGKTFVASNLAISLAQLDKRVLLVDCDLRIPRLHDIFGLDNDVGLAEILSADEPMTAAFQPTEIKNLHVLTAGRNRDFPAERLSSAAMENAIHEFQRFYNYVLLDSAPLLPVPDTVSIAKSCGELILVVRSRYTTEPSLQATLDIIERSNATVTGVVLNGVTATATSRSYYQTYEYGAGKT